MKVTITGFVVALLLAVAGCDLPDPNQEHAVRYRVTGSAQSVNITIETPSGTEQRPVSIPWTSPTYTFRGMDHAYIAAQNNGETGTVVVKLIVGGSTLKQASSSGAYSIASTDWLVGSDR